MRLLSFLTLAMFLFTGCAQAKISPSYKKDPNKHATLVMDADTGKVLFHEKGYSKRYPASLTKMMTLYMVFDSLKKGKLKKSTKMRASKLAASQPQTNVSIRKGQKIRVDTAIRALVVRSANDISVVFAEKIGGSQSRFARMMTNKAKKLGMKHTQFKNPHGLPNAAQYTTAYDMAILGKALRRDFPQYYGYFKTTQFSFNGKKFRGHNRVLGMYDGVDGIKTGYIRKSGFNLVSSIKKNGVNIVAVVMGGKSSKSRDSYMVKLLDKSYTHMANLKQRNSRRRFASKVPVPTSKPSRRTANVVESTSLATLPSLHIEKKPIKEPAQAAQAITTPIPTEKPNREESSLKVKKSITTKATPKAKIIKVKTAKPTKVASPKSEAPSFSISLRKVEPISNAEPTKEKVTFVASKKKKSKSKPNTLDYQLSKLSKSPFKQESKPVNYASNDIHQWGIQVGAFKDERTARAALKKAYRLVNEDVKDAYVTIANKGSSGVHRAQLGNLSKTQAQNACQKLQAMNQSCFPLQVN